MIRIAFGACSRIASETLFTMPALILSRSIRSMPGLRAMPLVMTTTSLFSTAAKSLLPSTFTSKSKMAPHCAMSRALPWGIPSTMSIIMTSARFFAAIW